MKRTVLFGAFSALILSSVSVGAADLNNRKKEPKAPYLATQPYNWTGFYAGAKGGYASGRSGFRYTTGAQANHNSKGFVGGLYAGYNHQYSNNIVLGLEADVNIGSINGSTHCPNPAFRCTSKLDWYSSLRGRAGYAMDRFLPYVTAGVAYGGVRKHTISPANVRAGQSRDRVGATVGAGLEYAVTKNLSVRAEYSYLNFSGRTYTVDAGLRVKGKNDAHVVMVGLTYKF